MSGSRLPGSRGDALIGAWLQWELQAIWGNRPAVTCHLPYKLIYSEAGTCRQRVAWGGAALAGQNPGLLASLSPKEVTLQWPPLPSLFRFCAAVGDRETKKLLCEDRASNLFTALLKAGNKKPRAT